MHLKIESFNKSVLKKVPAVQRENFAIIYQLYNSIKQLKNYVTLLKFLKREK